MEARQDGELDKVYDVLTFEQDRELDALVRIGTVIAVRKRWSHEKLTEHFNFLLSCLCSYWGLEVNDLPFVLIRVNEIAAQQKAEMEAEVTRGRKGLQA